MKSFLKVICAVAAALAASFVLLLVFTFLGTQTPRPRIENAVRTANDAGQLDPLRNIDNDLFTECSLLAAEMLRDSNVLHDIVSSNLASTNSFPCDVIPQYLAGAPREARREFRYFYGARHLVAVLVRVMSINRIRSLLAYLGYAAPFLLGAAFYFRARQSLAVISPLLVTLLVGMDLGNLGRNFAHSPGFVFPLLMLAAVVWWRESLTPLELRFGAYAVIAAVTAYFDILNGPLPFILAVTVIVNHYAFNSGRKDAFILWQAAGLCVLFPAAAATIIGLKLGMASLLYGMQPFREFLSALAIRMSAKDENLGALSYMQVVMRVWNSRALPFFNSSSAATLFHMAGLIAWLGGLILLIARRRDRYREFIVLAGSAFIIPLWYSEFMNHTFTHYQFMTRIGVLPAAAGLIAFIAMSDGLFRIAGILVVPMAGVLALVQHLERPQFLELRLEQHSSVDAASCSNDLQLGPDGKPDVVWRVTLSGSRFSRTRLSEVNIYRVGPLGVWSTRPGQFPVAVLSADGHLLSRQDRKVDVPISRQEELLFAVCKDNADTPQSRYSLTLSTSQGKIAAALTPP